LFSLQIDDDVSLRMFTERDTEELHLLTMESKDHLRKWLGWLDKVRSLEDTLQYIRRSFDTFTSLGGFPTTFAIIYRGEIAGTISFNHISEVHRNGSIGYWIGKRFEGKGIMSRSFEAVVNYDFETLRLNRIEVRVANENIRSRAIPERFGFKKEGVLQQVEMLYDTYVDHVVYRMLHAEWKARQRSGI